MGPLRKCGVHCLVAYLLRALCASIRVAQAFSTGGTRATCGTCDQSEWCATVATTKQKTERKKIYILELNTQLNQEVAVEFEPKIPA